MIDMVRNKEGKTNSNGKHIGVLEDMKINVKLKLSALWISIMFCYVYADILGHMRSDIIEGMLAGEVGGVPITQVSLLGSAILMVIPTIMIFLSLALPAEVNRRVNIILGMLFTGIVLITLLMPGGWAYYYVFALVEVGLYVMIVRYAWKWPEEGAHSSHQSSLRSPMIQIP